MSGRGGGGGGGLVGEKEGLMAGSFESVCIPHMCGVSAHSTRVRATGRMTSLSPSP